MVSDDVTNKTELLREKWFRAMGHEASMVAPRFNFEFDRPYKCVCRGKHICTGDFFVNNLVLV